MNIYNDLKNVSLNQKMTDHNMEILIFSNKDFDCFAPLTSKANKSEFYCAKLFNENEEKIARIRINNMIPSTKKKHNKNCKEN